LEEEEGEAIETLICRVDELSTKVTVISVFCGMIFFLLPVMLA
jgi:hypothetical protein